MSNDLNKLFKKIEGAVLKAVTRQENLEPLGQFLRDRIIDRTRLGFGVSEPGGSKEKLDPLSEKYKERRKHYRKVGYLSSKTTPARSNLTKTGEMLDSVRYRVVDRAVEIYVNGEENQRKARENAKMGRVFLNFSNLDLKDLKRQVVANVKKALSEIK